MHVSVHVAWYIEHRIISKLATSYLSALILKFEICYAIISIIWMLRNVSSSLIENRIHEVN